MQTCLHYYQELHHCTLASKEKSSIPWQDSHIDRGHMTLVSPENVTYSTKTNDSHVPEYVPSMYVDVVANLQASDMMNQHLQRGLSPTILSHHSLSTRRPDFLTEARS